MRLSVRVSGVIVCLVNARAVEEAPGLAIEKVRVLDKLELNFRVFRLASWSVLILGFLF